MFSALPTELCMEILQHAAWQFVADDRQTVVHLAQTSTMVYKVVASVLYHTMWITERNIASIQEFADEPSFHRICGLVRNLLVFDDSQITLEFKFFTLLESVTTFGDTLRILTCDCAELRTARIWSNSFSGATEMANALQGNLMHLAGDVTRSSEYASDPNFWLPAITKGFTSLTHLAFEVFEPSWQDKTCDMVAFKMLLRAALSDRRLHCVAVRFAGIYCSRFPELQQVASQVNDPRLHIWCDIRPLLHWDDDEVTAVSDALHGRSIWTEAAPLPMTVISSVSSSSSSSSSS